MTPQEKEINNNETEIKGQEKPFQWGDELESQEEKFELEGDCHSYTSIAELLEDEEEAEKKRLEEYLKKLSKSGISK